MISPAIFCLFFSAGPGSGDPSAEGWVKPEPNDLVRVLGMRWKDQLADHRPLSSSPEEWTSPYISRDRARVYAATTGGILTARSVEANEVLWTRDDLGSMGAALAEYRGHLLVGSAGFLFLLDDQTGKEEARIELAGAIGGRMAIHGSVAVIPTRPNIYHAVDLEKRAVIWRAKRSTPDGITLRGQAAPAIDPRAGRAYLGFSDGYLTAVSLADGKELWSVGIGKPGQGFADIDGEPQIVDGGAAVIAASYSGGTYKLEAATGRVLWKKEDLTRITGLTIGGPSGLVIASHGDRQALAIYPENGKVRWRFRFESGWAVEPVYLGGVLVAVSNAEGAIAILDVTTGKPIQLITPGSGASVPPSWRDPDLAVLSNKGMLLMLRLGAGTGITQ